MKHGFMNTAENEGVAFPVAAEALLRRLLQRVQRQGFLVGF
jgi:hypothetical protein